jgi:prepilin-type N-terminal cleavage/methylation domain-containing protein
MKTVMTADSPRPQRGATLIEVLVALVVLSIGILAVAGLFPAGSRTQVQDRMTTSASYYAQEKLEQLGRLPWNDAELTVGTHPATPEPVGNGGAWRRTWQVEAMTGQLSNLKKVTVTVAWSLSGARSVSATTYLRR